MNKTELQACIKDLQYVLDNWNVWVDAKNFARIEGVPTTRGIFDVDSGLCTNVLDAHLDIEYKEAMFEAWEGYSGAIYYPVGGEEEYELGEGSSEVQNYAENLYCNPNRMELAKHCLAYMTKDLKGD